MEPYNQPVNSTRDPGIDKLRGEYERLIQQPLPRRAKGIPYDYIIWLFQIPAILLSIGVLAVVDNKLHNIGVDILVLIFLLWFFFIFSERFYSLPKRTARNAFRRYPMLRTTANRLNEPGSKFLPDATILKIEGENLFLLRYGFVRWWAATPPGEGSGEINGMALVDEQGRVLDNPGLLEKAYSTLVLSVVGDHTLQFRDRKKRSEIMNTIQNILPRAEKMLKKQAKDFEAGGVGQPFKQLVDGLPVLYQALRAGMSIHSVNDRWRKALGWSFGLECLYEDALEYQKTCLAFSQFMAAAYGTQLLEVSNKATQLLQSVNTADKWKDRKNILWALSMLAVIPKAVQTWIFTYGVLGKPNARDLESVRRKLDKARSLGIPVVGQ